TCVRAQKRFMVHENFRFQPWHRELRRQIVAGAIGDRIHSITQQMRMGDGWPKDAYLNRQPYFRTMPRLLMYETGIHYVDVLRYLAGDEVDSVYAQMRTLNGNIAGEDDALVILNFAGGVRGLIDGNRYNEANHPDPRYTFGTTVVEGNGGTLRLYLDGRITLQRLGKVETEVAYHHEARGFAGDCVYATQQHFLEAFRTDTPFETDGEDYLKSLRVLETVYQSAAEQRLKTVAANLFA
ncbi:MAG: Gfo/Idh/MocA family oxidoreductase, partial [Bacteroidota bacterium]